MTSQQSTESKARNIAPNGLEMVRILSAWKGNEDLRSTLHHASNSELFLWWHEAMSHSLTALPDAPWEQRMCEALASEIAKECVRRMA